MNLGKQFLFPYSSIEIVFNLGRKLSLLRAKGRLLSSVKYSVVHEHE
ncbi:hypothetical protein ACFLTX_00315 [Chloroflexota bacterium]